MVLQTGTSLDSRPVGLRSHSVSRRLGCGRRRRDGGGGGAAVAAAAAGGGDAGGGGCVCVHIIFAGMCACTRGCLCVNQLDKYLLQAGM